MDNQNTQWYASWFDSPYYHVLYNDRNTTEADRFMKVLTRYLGFEAGDNLLDLGCGRGRHSRYLGSQGYQVLGVDLSATNIHHASQYAAPNLQFKVHDILEPVGQKFDGVFNLFTSFGYFDSDAKHEQALSAIKASLLPDGVAVIDFMNVNHVINHLVPEETKEVSGISFDIKRYHKSGYIYKEIRFVDSGASHFFCERIKALTYKDFELYFERVGLHFLEVFGDYTLAPYHAEFSPRLLLLVN